MPSHSPNPSRSPNPRVKLLHATQAIAIILAMILMTPILINPNASLVPCYEVRTTALAGPSLTPTLMFESGYGIRFSQP